MNKTIYQMKNLNLFVACSKEFDFYFIVEAQTLQHAQQVADEYGKLIGLTSIDVSPFDTTDALETYDCDSIIRPSERDLWGSYEHKPVLGKKWGCYWVSASLYGDVARAENGTKQQMLFPVNMTKTDALSKELPAKVYFHTGTKEYNRFEVITNARWTKTDKTVCAFAYVYVQIFAEGWKNAAERAAVLVNNLISQDCFPGISNIAASITSDEPVTAADFALVNNTHLPFESDSSYSDRGLYTSEKD